MVMRNWLSNLLLKFQKTADAQRANIRRRSPQKTLGSICIVEELEAKRVLSTAAIVIDSPSIPSSSTPPATDPSTIQSASWVVTGSGTSWQSTNSGTLEAGSKTSVLIVGKKIHSEYSMRTSETSQRQ
jgi:hypothetical protein